VKYDEYVEPGKEYCYFRWIHPNFDNRIYGNYRIKGTIKRTNSN